MKARTLGNRCQCAGCGLLFTSTREFDRHRAGDYALPGQWQGARFCLSVAELLARGWRSDVRGYWMRTRPHVGPVGVEGPSATPPARGVARPITTRKMSRSGEGI